MERKMKGGETKEEMCVHVHQSMSQIPKESETLAGIDKPSKAEAKRVAQMGEIRFTNGCCGKVAQQTNWMVP